MLDHHKLSLQLSKHKAGASAAGVAAGGAKGKKGQDGAAGAGVICSTTTSIVVLLLGAGVAVVVGTCTRLMPTSSGALLVPVAYSLPRLCCLVCFCLCLFVPSGGRCAHLWTLRTRNQAGSSAYQHVNVPLYLLSAPLLHVLRVLPQPASRLGHELGHQLGTYPHCPKP